MAVIAPIQQTSAASLPPRRPMQLLERGGFFIGEAAEVC
jgi:hypothetical protein